QRIVTHWALGSNSPTPTAGTPPATSTPTRTWTWTPIPPTNTPIPTKTNTPIPTNTLPAAATNTPSWTATKTETPTNTPIGPTATPTRTNTPLPTWTPTPTSAPATPGAYVWSQRLGGTTSDSGNAVSVDNAGNMFVAGFFTGSVDFGGGPVPSAGMDIFVAKYLPNGQYSWLVHKGNGDSHAAMGAGTDSAGSVIITGKFENTIDFGCGPLTSGVATSYDIFIAKISATGGCVWSKSFGSGNDDIGYGVAVDSTDNVIVTGTFVGRVSFG